MNTRFYHSYRFRGMMMGLLFVLMMSGGNPSWLPCSWSQTTDTEMPNLISHAQSAILMDANSGTVLFEKNKDTKLPLASITKIMTMLLIMESIEQGKLAMSDVVRASEYAASMGGSQIFLQVGEEMTVEDLVKGIALASGNDASVAMAEHLAGSEEAFVQQMNQRATQLGMKNTHFVNCNGLPQENHYSTAYDIALMSQALLRHERITSFTGIYQDYLRKASEKPFWLVNTNKLVRFYSGADGLKTGYTQAAKFCLSATAKKDQLRVIAVVMGEPDSKTRQAEVTRLLDYAFAQYSSYPVIQKGNTIAEFRIPNGETARIPLIAQENYHVLLKKGEPVEGIRYEIEWEAEIQAPIARNQPIAKLKLIYQNQVKREIQLVSPTDISRASWWTRSKRFMKSMVGIKE